MPKKTEIKETEEPGSGPVTVKVMSVFDEIYMEFGPDVTVQMSLERAEEFHRLLGHMIDYCQDWVGKNAKKKPKRKK